MLTVLSREAGKHGFRNAMIAASHRLPETIADSPERSVIG
jgi:hypothetical protein